MSTKDLRYVLITIVSVIVFTLLLDRIIFYSLNYISDQIYSGQAVGKYNYFHKIKEDKDVLYLGSSRTSRHFKSNVIADNSFNMGMDGTKIAYSGTLFLTLPKNKKQTILFQIDPEYVTDSTYTGSDLDALFPYYNRNREIRRKLKFLNLSNPFQDIFYSLSYNGKVLSVLFNFIKKNNEYQKMNGYEPNIINENQQKNLAIEIKKFLAKEETCIQNPTINSIYKSYLMELKLFAEQNNKKVIFVTTPRYMDNCPEDNIVLHSFMDSLKLTYYDDTNYFQNKNDNLYWKDIGHMSDQGATVYAKRVKELIQKN